MALKDWKQTSDFSWYNKKEKKALWITEERGYGNYINKWGYIVNVGKSIPLKPLYSKPKTKQQAIDYAMAYMRKN